MSQQKVLYESFHESDLLCILRRSKSQSPYEVGQASSEKDEVRVILLVPLRVVRIFPES